LVLPATHRFGVGARVLVARVDLFCWSVPWPGRQVPGWTPVLRGKW